MSSNWTALHFRHVAVRAIRCIVRVLFRRHWCLSHPCVLLLVRIELIRVAMLLRLRWWPRCNWCMVTLRVCSAALEQQEACDSDESKSAYNTSDYATDCAARYALLLLCRFGLRRVRDSGGR